MDDNYFELMPEEELTSAHNYYHIQISLFYQ